MGGHDPPHYGIFRLPLRRERGQLQPMKGPNVVRSRRSGKTPALGDHKAHALLDAPDSGILKGKWAGAMPDGASLSRTAPGLPLMVFSNERSAVQAKVGVIV